MRLSGNLSLNLKEALKGITTKDVLSKENKNRCIEKLQGMKPIDERKRKLTTTRNAAVLVPLCTVNNQPSLLYIVRSHELKVNAGQVAFPGGMKDESDRDLEETALRETFEEIGLPQSLVHVWTKGPMLGRDNVLITPYLGYLGDLNIDQLVLNKSEVAKVFTMTLEELCNPLNFRTTQFRPKGSAGYKLPVYLGGPERIWGVTALITHVIMMALVPKFYKHKIRYQPIVSNSTKINVDGSLDF